MAQFCGDVGRFVEGLAVSNDGEGKWYHALLNGQPAYSRRFKKTEYFQSGLAWAQLPNGTWIRIDKEGNEVKMKNTNEARV